VDQPLPVVVTASSRWVSCRAFEPSASASHTSPKPDRCEVKRTVFPSGEYSGAQSHDVDEMKGRGFLSSFGALGPPTRQMSMSLISRS
jgi:hypothetical protein